MHLIYLNKFETTRLCSSGKSFHKSMDDLGYRANFEEYPSFDDQDSHLSRNPTASPANQKSSNSNAPSSGISNYDTYKKIRNNANNQSNKLMIHDQNRNISNNNNNNNKNDDDNLKSNSNYASNLIANRNTINNNHQLATLQANFNNKTNTINNQEINQPINNTNNNASSSILNLGKNVNLNSILNFLRKQL